jgi:hypothetical protein
MEAHIPQRFRVNKGATTIIDDEQTDIERRIL